MSIRTISKITDLHEYGFHFLTGEACGFGQRHLYDLTLRGVRIFCNAFGLKQVVNPVGDYRYIFSDPWNGGTGIVASIMIAPCCLPQIAVACLVDSGCSEVIETDGQFIGLSAGCGEYDRKQWDSIIRYRSKERQSNRNDLTPELGRVKVKLCTLESELAKAYQKANDITDVNDPTGAVIPSIFCTLQAVSDTVASLDGVHDKLLELKSVVEDAITINDLIGRGHRIYRTDGSATRNEHAMSGRVE